MDGSAISLFFAHEREGDHAMFFISFCYSYRRTKLFIPTRSSSLDEDTRDSTNTTQTGTTLVRKEE